MKSTLIVTLVMLLLVGEISGQGCTDPPTEIQNVVDSTGNAFTVCAETTQPIDNCSAYSSVSSTLSPFDSISAATDLTCSLCESGYFLIDVLNVDSPQCLEDGLEVFQCVEYSFVGADCQVCLGDSVQVGTYSDIPACVDPSLIVDNCDLYILLEGAAEGEYSCQDCLEGSQTAVVKGSTFPGEIECISDDDVVFDCPEYGRDGEGEIICDCGSMTEIVFDDATTGCAVEDDLPLHCIEYSLENSVINDGEMINCNDCEELAVDSTGVDKDGNQIKACVLPTENQDDCDVYKAFEGNFWCYDCADGFENLPVDSSIDFGICSSEDPISRCTAYSIDSASGVISCQECEVGYLMNDVRDKCFLLVEFCSSYTDAGVCQACISGYDLSDNADECAEDDHCRLESGDICIACDPGYIFDRKGNCILPCGEGQFLLFTTLTCQDGNIDGCLYYFSEAICQTCQENYTLSSDQTRCTAPSPLLLEPEPANSPDFSSFDAGTSTVSSLQSVDECPASTDPLRRNVLVPTNYGDICESIDIECLDDPPRVGGCLMCQNGSPSFEHPMTGLHICLSD